MNQFKFALHTFLAITCAMVIHSKSFAEPINLSFFKSDLKHYHDAGLYQNELSQELAPANSYLVKRADANKKLAKPKKLALVLDIDETSLSNYDNLVARDFANDKQSIERAMLAADAPAIEPTLKLYQTALKHHIAVFFVTGRNPSLKKATENNLKRAGYITWSGLYFKSDQYHQKSVVPFKANARKVIEQEGYTVIASIGDQHSDLKGGYAEKTFKLANPYYYIP